jgi:hypothetical protein
MDPLSIAASIVALLQVSEAALSSCYRFVGKVNDAAPGADRIIRGVGYLKVILKDLHGLCDDKSALPSLTAMADDQGPLETLAKDLEELKGKLAGSFGPMSLRQKLKWPFESEKVNEILGRIQKQTPILELAVTGDNAKMTPGIKNSLEDTERREKREKVLNWLRSADPAIKHLASRRLHQPGSNNWFLQAESFKEWEQTSNQTLWIHGIPGAGKTIICSTIIDHVESLCQSQPEIRLA